MFQNQATLIAVTLTALTAMSCGKAAQNSSSAPLALPSPNAQVQTADLKSAAVFKAWISKGRDAHATVPEETVQTSPPYLRGTALQFDDVIPFSGADVQPLFLEWGSDVLGSPIIDAHFSTVKIDRNNQSARNTTRRNARRSDGGGWFIPIQDVVSGEPLTNIDPADIYWINLELTLKDGSTVNYQVGLRLQGPLPFILSQGIQPAGSGRDPHTVGANLLKGGEFGSLGSEKITNPVVESMKLWVRAATTPIRFYTVLSVTQFKDSGSGRIEDRIVPAPPIAFKSEQLLEMKRVGILTQAGGKSSYEERELATDFSGIELPAHGVITLNWFPTHRELIHSCPIPSPSVRTFSWNFFTFISSIQKTEVWNLENVGVSGTIYREVLLGERSLSAKQTEAALNVGDTLRGRVIADSRQGLSPELFPEIGHHFDEIAGPTMCHGAY